MNEFFGLSMTTIMVVLLTVLAVCLAAVGYVVLRNRILFFMGLRNMPRRMAQTVLIVIGLMLSTLIISAALSTGDTVDYSISKLAYETLGHVDETIQPGNLQKDASSLGDSGLDVEGDQYREFQQAIKTANNPSIDGSMGVLFEPAPVLNPTSRLSEPHVELTGLDTSALDGFPDVISAENGRVLDVASLAPNEAYMNERAADKLGTMPGDTVRFWVNNEPHEFKILDIVKDRVLTGVANDEHKEGIVTRLAPCRSCSAMSASALSRSRTAAVFVTALRSRTLSRATFAASFRTITCAWALETPKTTGSARQNKSEISWPRSS